MLASSDTGGKKRENHVVPSNIVKGNELQLKETPLCTLIVSFTDDEANDVTSAHVFTMSTPQLYPQTRKTVYKKGTFLCPLCFSSSVVYVVFVANSQKHRKFHLKHLPLALFFHNFYSTFDSQLFPFLSPSQILFAFDNRFGTFFRNTCLLFLKKRLNVQKKTTIDNREMLRQYEKHLNSEWYCGIILKIYLTYHCINCYQKPINFSLRMALAFTTSRNRALSGYCEEMAGSSTNISQFETTVSKCYRDNITVYMANLHFELLTFLDNCTH
ncbi:Protein CBG27390 [Caenorhabditis briggsae]|uniref:Protein CBG27390 n=1 Tax=Caenorhabditis briggsae TaxID=6238 RepID=B6IH06_CAEBR|nr:Protein CBG27390 [Caenorhabditis briggsae]CAR99186.1 Protein CBG27390 [Caenorhabditis briggsae]